MEVFGYLAAVLIGLSLGLIGGGGSILTVPVLVYLFGLNPVLATSYSLFVVGGTSLIGAFQYFKKKLVSIRTGLLFGASSITTVFITRKWLLPQIPEHLFQLGSFVVTKSLLTLVLFAMLMVVAAIAMIKNGRNPEAPGPTAAKKIQLPKLFGYGIFVGLATGLLGAGGGFLLIPALVLLVGLPMKKAVGTSLFIIALNSLIGFTGDLGHYPIDWIFLFKITGIALIGILIGGYLSKKIQGEKLKKGFGVFVLLMGLYILLKELFF